jgi:hypothetical protein
MSHDVIDVEVAGGLRLILTFEGGEKREVDMASIVPLEGIFQPLSDPAFFRQVQVSPDLGTICWPNGADICPDVLYEQSRPLAASSIS